MNKAITLPAKKIKMGRRLSKNEFMSFLVSQASEIVETEEHAPMFFFLQGEELLILSASTLFTSDEGKDVAAQIVREYVVNTNPDMVAFVSEAWMAKVEEGESTQIRARNHPNKVEILQILIEDRSEQVVRIFEIRQTGKSGRRTLKEQDLKGSLSMGGRFFSFFTKPKKENLH